MNQTPSLAFSVGKYHISPSSRVTESGDYIASLSIRSGRGISSHDRVFRFVPRFATSEGALDYAARQGRHLVNRQCAA